MKTPLTLLFIAIASCIFAQPPTRDDYVQNFYQTCKQAKYGAFQDVQVGVQLLDTKQYERSINRFTKALRKDKTCTDAYYMLAYCYQQLQRYDESLVYADSAILNNPSSPSAWVIKGTTLMAMGRLADSEQCFKKAIESAPEIMDGYYGLALACYRQNKLSEASEMIAKAAAIKPTEVRDGKKLKKLNELVSR